MLMLYLVCAADIVMDVCATMPRIYQVVYFLSNTRDENTVVRYILGYILQTFIVPLVLYNISAGVSVSIL